MDVSRTTYAICRTDDRTAWVVAKLEPNAPAPEILSQGALTTALRYAYREALGPGCFSDLTETNRTVSEVAADPDGLPDGCESVTIVCPEDGPELWVAVAINIRTGEVWTNKESRTRRATFTGNYEAGMKPEEFRALDRPGVKATETQYRGDLRAIDLDPVYAASLIRKAPLPAGGEEAMAGLLQRAKDRRRTARAHRNVLAGNEGRMARRAAIDAIYKP